MFGKEGRLSREDHTLNGEAQQDGKGHDGLTFHCVLSCASLGPYPTGANPGNRASASPTVWNEPVTITVAAPSCTHCRARSKSGSNLTSGGRPGPKPPASPASSPLSTSRSQRRCAGALAGTVNTNPSVSRGSWPGSPA